MPIYEAIVGCLGKCGLNRLACIAQSVAAWTFPWVGGGQRLKLAFYDVCLHVPGTGGRCDTKL